MWKCNRSDFKHYLYNPNRRSKSWEKLKKAVERYIDILKKEAVQWTTARVSNTKKQAQARLTKYWINQKMIQSSLERKWLEHLYK